MLPLHQEEFLLFFEPSSCSLAQANATQLNSTRLIGSFYEIPQKEGSPKGSEAAARPSSAVQQQQPPPLRPFRALEECAKGEGGGGRRRRSSLTFRCCRGIPPKRKQLFRDGGREGDPRVL